MDIVSAIMQFLTAAFGLEGLSTNVSEAHQWG